MTRAAAIGFIERKYNQISYLTNFLKKLDDIVFVHDELYFEEDAKRIFGNDSKEERKRDPYLHRLYKNQLQEESVAVFGDTRCMVERIAYPVLIASHIKPFCRCNEQEAYDAENGILLSRNIDSLFDLGYLTFDNDGTPVPAETLNEELKRKLADYRLGEEFLTEKRRAYLVYHRNEIFGKKFKS